MATQLQIMNRVLRRLREDQAVGSTDNEYTALVAEFVLDAVNAVSEAHNWDSNTHKVEFDTVIDQNKYNLSTNVSGGGAALDSDTRLATYRSRVAMDATNLPLAFTFDDDTDAYGEQMRLVSWRDMIRIQQPDTSLSNEKPWYFSMSADESQGLELEFAYKPTHVRRIKIWFYTEVGDFESDGTTDNVEVYLPKDAVFWHAYKFALNERGEEYGEPTAAAHQRYMEVLASAIHTDVKHDEVSNQYDWYRG